MRADWLGGVLHDAGLKVVPMDGWQTRGGPLTSILGVVCHHTATGANWADEAVANLLVHGRADLAGPLAQLGLDRQGRYWLIAAGRCNHNGFGTWGNQSIGIEGFNDGVREAWPTVQVDAYHRGVAAICRHQGLTAAAHVKGHKETDPQRKVDPRNLSMNVFRQSVAALLSPPSSSAPQEDLLMPAALNDDDARRALILDWYLEDLGRLPIEADVDGHLLIFRAKGAYVCRRGIAGSPEATARRKTA